MHFRTDLPSILVLLVLSNNSELSKFFVFRVYNQYQGCLLYTIFIMLHKTAPSPPPHQGSMHFGTDLTHLLGAPGVIKQQGSILSSLSSGYIISIKATFITSLFLFHPPQLDFNARVKWNGVIRSENV